MNTLSPHLFFLLLILCTNCFATNYYLSAAGNDANTGTSTTTPWRTLSKLSAALSPGNIIVPNDKIFFRKGDVFRGTILFSHWNNAGITFDSYGTGEMPIIKGSMLTSNWTVHNGNIWKTTVSERVYFLYVNNQMQTLA